MAMEDEQEMKSDLSSLLEVNRLDYRLPPSLSIATSRSMKQFRSSKTDHVAGESQVDFQLSSGAAYVDLLNSYLSFDVDISATADDGTVLNLFMPSHAGWLQFIKAYRIIHSSGVELDRQNDSVGEWIQIQNQYGKSEATRKTKGALYRLNDANRPVPLNTEVGYYEAARSGIVADPTNYTPTLDVAGGETLGTAGKLYHAVVPLGELAGIFDQDLLAPSFLTAGLRIELQFHTKEHFFKKTTAWAVNEKVTIKNPAINLECFTLTDSITRKLSQISASSGLEWYWDAVHHMNSVQATNSVTVQITRALSRANAVIVKTRNDFNMNNRSVDSLASQPWIYDVPDNAANAVGVAIEKENDGTLSQFQVQLGAQFIPSQPIAKREAFLHSALKTFSQFRRSDEVGGVDMMDFAGLKTLQSLVGQAGEYEPGLAIATVPLESSSTLQQSGSAISAQRTAVVNLEWSNAVKNAGVAGNRRIDVFVPYSKLATLFLDSVVVRS